MTLPPSFDGPLATNGGYPGGHATPYRFPYWPIGYNSDFYTAGGDAVTLGYLTEIWQEICRDQRLELLSEHHRIPRVGSIVETFHDLLPNVMVATLDIDYYPNSADMIFGENPLIDGGVCGFGYFPFQAPGVVKVTEFEDFTINRFLRGGAARGGIYRSSWQYVNQIHQVFFSPTRECNDFWWHLKEGVIASVSVYRRDRYIPIDVHFGQCGIPFGPSDGGLCATKSVFDETDCDMRPDGSLCVPPNQA